MITWSYTLFHVILGAIGIATFALLQFYIIPDFVEDDKKKMAAEYTNYSLTIYLSILSIGSVLSNWISTRRISMKKGAKGIPTVLV